MRIYLYEHFLKSLAYLHFAKNYLQGIVKPFQLEVFSIDVFKMWAEIPLKWANTKRVWRRNGVPQKQDLCSC